ncbi:MAG TPA: hypothetical protein VIL73_03895 [Gaiellaceae bacterium]|jgi:hypothetical protein
MPDHNYPCPGCGAYEDRDCRCSGADYEAAARARLKDRLVWKAGDVELVEADAPASVARFFDRNSTADFADWGDRGPLRYKAEEPQDGFAAALKADSERVNPWVHLEARLREAAEAAGDCAHAARVAGTGPEEWHRGCQTAFLKALDYINEACITHGPEKEGGST